MLGHRRPRREERGAAAVEFALVVPILIVVVFGIVNLAVLLSQQLSLTNSARQAARYAAVEGNNCAAITTEARQSAVTIGMNITQVPTPTISPACVGTGFPCTDQPLGTDVTIEMARTPSWVISFPPLFTSSTVPELKASARMRCEFQ